MTYQGKQGPTYTAGVSAETAGSRALWLGSVTLPPGGRTKAHIHEHHESAFYLIGGDEVELWTGDQLQHREVARAGDFMYIPAGVLHVAVNRSESSSALARIRTSRKASFCIPNTTRRSLSSRLPALLLSFGMLTASLSA
jgi:uncharacterized RmlC-like cupin family protein